MAFGMTRSMTAPLAFINFGLYVVSASLAGSILNRNLDGKEAFIGELPMITAFLDYVIFNETKKKFVKRFDRINVFA